MAKKYRITGQRSGVKYEHKYADTIGGAIKIAKKRLADGSEYTRPFSVDIQRRSESLHVSWETVCVHSALRDVVTPVDELSDYRQAQNQKLQAEVTIKQLELEQEDFAKRCNTKG